jgi:hypothetical protein
MEVEAGKTLYSFCVLGEKILILMEESIGSSSVQFVSRE